MRAHGCGIRANFLSGSNPGSVASASAKTVQDFDAVEAVNLGCLLHAHPADAIRQSAKVVVLADALKMSATASPFRVDALEWSIVEEKGYRAALDCDVLFSLRG